jgi:hypothetical protein
MTRKLLIVCLAVSAALFAADDPWAKVRELKSGTEIRIVKRGTATPVLAQMGELTDDNLVIIVKNEQTAIARDQIERIDARPKGSRVKNESRVTTEQTMGKPDGSRPAPAVQSNQSYSSGLAIGSKPDFETVYRRTAPLQQKKREEPAAEKK